MENEINTWLEDVNQAIEEIFSFPLEKKTTSNFKKTSRENEQSNGI